MKTKIITAIALTLMLTGIARAQFDSDNQILTISAETNNWDIPLYVGFTNSSDQIQIINGGVFSEPANYDADIGFNANANGNSVVVSGAGSAWLYGGQPGYNGNMYIGNSGSSNSLLIINRGTMICPETTAYRQVRWIDYICLYLR